MKDRKKLEILKTKEQIVSKRTSEGKFWNVNNIGITCRYRVSRYLYKYFLSGILDIFNLPGLFVKFKNNFWLRSSQNDFILKKISSSPFYLSPPTYIAIFTPLVRFLRNRMKYSIIQYSMYITFNYLYKQIILNVTKIYTSCSFFSYLIRYLIFLLAIFVPLI